MSYDLYFYRKNKNPISKVKIQGGFKEMIPIDISEVETQIHYENERTGVYFLIDINEPNVKKDDVELFDSFVGFENTDVSASINFFRPDYFGHEIFPIIGKICEKFDLYVFNPQEFDKTREVPLKWTTNELIEHWTDHNTQVSKQQFEELQLKYYPKDKSDKIWEYTSMINTLENDVNEDIYIPNIFMIMNQKSKNLFSYIVWNQSIPLILPKVDFIILVKNYKKLVLELPVLIANTDYKASYFIKLLNLKRPTYYRKLKENSFNIHEVEILTKALYPREAFLEEIKQSVEDAKEQVKNGEVLDHQTVMASFEKKYL